METPAGATILLVRHGHVPGIAPERFRGRTDIDLTDRGAMEARKTAEWIARFWRPIWITSSKPAVVTRAVRAPLRSSKAFVATVDP